MEWIDPRDAEYYAAQTEALWAALRAERDRRLTASDKYALPDYPQSETQRSAWLTYRQALRDLPENTTDPTAPDWPVAPEATA
ncbi:MAG TPA: tail fiber assembly protein [Paenirhodobacter sp.]